MNDKGARISLLMPRLDPKPWGGRKLERYGLELPPEAPIGEALITAGEAVIAGGDGEGRTLQDLIDEDSCGRLGERALAAVGGRALFPLLVKLIDAAGNLSIQVHPDDEGARSMDRPGKTEAWHILDATPGAKLYLGLNPDVDLETFTLAARKLDGSSGNALRVVEAKPGMTVLIPAGTIHALGAGVMVYEIQQPSDITFRLDDWGRVDEHGRPREMHIRQGLEVAQPAYRPAPIEPIRLGDRRVDRHLLVACHYFALERLRIPVGGSVQPGIAGSPQVLTVLLGAGRLHGADDVDLAVGSSAVIWPSGHPVTFTATESSEILLAWVPDIMREVVTPARVAGATDASIVALGGELPDIASTLAL